jgi:hypothetical protein
MWHDVDDDGLLDLFVVNYLLVTIANKKICDYGGVAGYCGPGSYEAAPDHVYINQGDGTFSERSEELGFAVEGGKGLAIVALDLDDDQQSEIYVLNDMMEKFLFTRNSTHDALLAEPSKRRMYANVAPFAGCAVSDMGLHEASMGVSCLDFDGDLRVDMYLTHYYAAKNTLYRNLGNLVFHDDSRRTRVAATSWEYLGFGTVALDYDRDRRDDIFVTNGHVLGPLHSPYQMHPLLLRNDRGRFVEDVAPVAGDYFRDLWLGRGAAGADYDNDGDLDIAVTHLDRPFALLRNDTQTERHFVGLDLSTPNRLPLAGGRIVVTANGKQTLVPLIAGGSYLSTGDTRVLVGLDDVQQASITVYWPGGGIETFDLPQVDRYWRIRPGRPPEVVDYRN